MTLRNWNLDKYISEQNCDNCSKPASIMTTDGFMLCNTCERDETTRYVFDVRDGDTLSRLRSTA